MIILQQWSYANKLSHILKSRLYASQPILPLQPQRTTTDIYIAMNIGVDQSFILPTG